MINCITLRETGATSINEPEAEAKPSLPVNGHDTIDIREKRTKSWT